MQKKIKKRSMSLLEIMVVIFIIGIIGTVIGINMKGSLEEGKAFKSEKGSKQVYEILTLELAKGDLTPENLTVQRAKEAIRNSGFASDPDKLLKDGWENEYRIYKTNDGSDIRVYSRPFMQFMQKKGKTQTEIRSKYPWMNTSGCTELEKK